MPKYVSRFHERVDYHASPEYHAQIEALLERLDAREPGAAKDTIFRLVVHERVTKGRAILEALCRRYPDFAPTPEPLEDPDTEYVSISALMAELAASNPRQCYDEFGQPLPREKRTPPTIYEAITQAEAAMPSESKAQAAITAQTLDFLEDALDVAIEDRDGKRR